MIVLGIGTKQERIPFLATVFAHIYNSSQIIISFFNISSFTEQNESFWNSNNEFCCLLGNIYLSEVSTFSTLVSAQRGVSANIGITVLV